MMFINCGRARKDHLCQKILLFTSLLTGGISQLYCPELAELGSSAQLTCIYPHNKQVTYRKTSVVTSVGTCDPDDGCNVEDGDRFSATNINRTHSRLTITSVQVSDGGEWMCEDPFNSERSGCTIYPFKTPTCNITSGNDTNYLDIHENILLLVNVIDYYCSSTIYFLLRAGNIETDLLKNHTMSEKTITSDVFDSTFNVNESHIGCVELIFICHNVRKAVQCGGVQSLKKRPPMCKITADRDAGGWEVGDEITLSVYIEDYFCSGDLEYFLQTGGETNRLNVTGIYNGAITFTAKKSHFGPVYLDMKCKNVSRNLTCDGIKELSKRQHTSSSYPLPGIECDTRSCLLLLGVGTGVAGTLLLVGLCHLVIYLIRKKNTVCMSGNHYDGLQGRNVDARTGYDDVGIPRSQGADAAEGGEYEMTGNHYENPQRGNDDDTANYVEMDKPATEGI